MKLIPFANNCRSCYAFSRNLFIICGLFAITNISNAYAEQKITALTLNKKQISKTANDIKNVRFSFIDLSNRKRIGVREINYWGKSTNFFELQKELLDHDAKNYRWGAALNYDTKLDCFIVGLWKRGIFRFSRKGEILA